MKYVAQDGKIFENEDKCLAYEKELEEKVKTEKLKNEERDKRWEEVVTAKENYIKLYEQYKTDHPNPRRNLITNDFDFDRIMRNIFGV